MNGSVTELLLAVQLGTQHMVVRSPHSRGHIRAWSKPGAHTQQSCCCAINITEKRALPLERNRETSQANLPAQHQILRRLLPNPTLTPGILAGLFHQGCASDLESSMTPEERRERENMFGWGEVLRAPSRLVVWDSFCCLHHSSCSSAPETSFLHCYCIWGSTATVLLSFLLCMGRT